MKSDREVAAPQVVSRRRERDDESSGSELEGDAPRREEESDSEEEEEAVTARREAVRDRYICIPIYTYYWLLDLCSFQESKAVHAEKPKQDLLSCWGASLAHTTSCMSRAPMTVDTKSPALIKMHTAGCKILGG